VASAGAAVTSITLQPLIGLKYASTYTLRLTADIADLDDGMNGTPAHKPLTPYTTTFTTFAPTGLGQTDEGFTSGGLAIVGDRAYVAQNQGDRTRLRLFDVSDPVTPVEITGPDNPSFALHRPPPVFIIGNPADLAVEDESPVTGGRLLAVATNPYSMPFHPANIHLYDVSNDQTWNWIGAVTLGKEPQDGLIKRLVLRGTRLYALVAGQGKAPRSLDRWIPSREELADYLPRVGELLGTTALRTQRKKVLAGNYATLFRNLVLTTAWQESCWRQFVRRGKEVRPLTSSVGAIGIMQVNPHVWRGFYDVQALRTSTKYNAEAGSEILHHYLIDYAVKKGEDTVRKSFDDLARATYAAYNAGPRQLDRYRRAFPKGETGHRIDADFWAKYQKIKSGNDLAVKACFPGLDA